MRNAILLALGVILTTGYRTGSLSVRPSAAGCESDIIILVDSSGSVSKIFKDQKLYVQKLLKSLDPTKNRLALIVYSGGRRYIKLHSLKSKQIRTGISNLSDSISFLNGGTSSGAALEIVLEELKNRRSGVPANVIVLTDGFSFDRIDDPIRKLISLNQLHTFAVSVGQFHQQSELMLIAGGKKKNIFVGKDTAYSLIKRLKTCKKGSKKETDANRPTTPNPVVKKPTENEHKKPVGKKKKCSLDVVFVFDASSSTRTAFEDQKTIAYDIYKHLDRTLSINYAIVKFSGDQRSRVVVPMSENKTVEEFHQGLRSIRTIGGTTYIARALRRVTELLNNHRSTQKQLVIVLTDGYLQDDPQKDVKTLQSRATLFVVPSAEHFHLNKQEFVRMASQKKYAFLDRNLDDIVDSALSEVANTCS